jgi:hypothetical protein
MPPRKKPAAKKTTRKTAKKTAKKPAVKKKAAKKPTTPRSGNKTVQTDASVEAFIAKAPAKYQDDAHRLVEIMSSVSKHPPKMWGPSIIGFGSYHYKYESGHEGDFMLTGFAPRASAISLYIMGSFPKRAELLEKLGKHKAGKGCLYIQSLDDIHIPTLKTMIRESIKFVKATYKHAPGARG